MPTIIDNLNDNTERTVRIFDRFYQSDLAVNANEFDVVFSYFKSVCETEVIAGNFTSNLFRISQQSEINVLELLDQLKGITDKLQMNKVICYYLNSFKNNTALYGVSVIPKANQTVARNVVL
jgi:hypothetical protein